MRITAFNGAMRGQKSITSLMVNSFLEGAREAGAQTEHVVLTSKKIRHCLGCLSCWVKTPGKCIQKDDMADLMEKYLASDIVVIASPVYVENVTGLMKDFLDRLIPLTDPRFESDEMGHTRHVKRYESYPGIVAMSNSGFIEPEAFAVLRLLFRRVARSMNADFVAEIFKGGGGMLGLDHAALRPMVDEYLSLLRKAGAEIATSRRLTEETLGQLEAQMMPTDVYNEQVNTLWERLMRKTTPK